MSSLKESAFSLFLVTILTQVLSLVFSVVFARSFGTESHADSYFLLMTIPLTLFGVANALFLRPLIFHADRTQDNGGRVYGQAYTLAFIGSFSLALILFFVARPLTLWLLGRDESLLLRIIVPLICVLSVASVTNSGLHREHRFFIAHLLRPGGLIGALFGLFFARSVFALTAGYVTGSLITEVVAALVLSKRAIVPLSPFPLAPEFRAIFAHALPLAFASVLYYVFRQAPLFFAVRVGEGAAALLGYTLPFLYMIPPLVAEPLSTAVFPRISKSTKEEVVARIEDMLSLVFFVSGLVMVVLIFVSSPLFSIGYQKGTFTPEDASTAASLLSLLALATIPICVQSLFASVLVGLGRVWQYCASLLIQVAVFMLVVLTQQPGLNTIILAMVFGLWVTPLAQGVFFLDILLRVRMKDGVKTLLAVGGAYGCLVVVGEASSLVGLIGGVVFISLVYLGIAYLMRHAALIECIVLLKKRVGLPPLEYN